MKKQLLLSTILGAVLALSLAQGGAQAATSASQTVTGTLGTIKKVETNAGNITSTIDPDLGTLNTAFTPGFKITTNSGLSQNMAMTAVCNTSGGNVNAFSGDGLAGSTYLTLTTAGETGLPAAAAVTNAQGAAVPASNGNVISYAINPPAGTAGQLVYTWVPSQYNAALTHKGETLTSLTVPSAAPKTGTFSFDDEPGSYQATITLSFV